MNTATYPKLERFFPANDGFILRCFPRGHRDHADNTHRRRCYTYTMYMCTIYTVYIANVGPTDERDKDVNRKIERKSETAAGGDLFLVLTTQTHKDV